MSNIAKQMVLRSGLYTELQSSECGKQQPSAKCSAIFCSVWYSHCTSVFMEISHYSFKGNVLLCIAVCEPLYCCHNQAI